MAGILHAESVLRRRRLPHYKAPGGIGSLRVSASLPTVACGADHRALRRHPHRHEQFDRKGGATSDLFRDYLVSTKKLLLSEPASSLVWVSVISTDSFGGVHVLLQGWTPEAHGVFTDDLTRARRQLAASFEARSSGMAPIAGGTDIFGSLWHLKALFEFDLKSDTHAAKKTIWIFSDMVNETPNFLMPALIGSGPDRMLDRAKANGLLVPLKGY